MADWFNFALYALQQIVNTVFNLDLGLGFTLGDFEVACLVIGLIATALIIKTGSSVQVSHTQDNRSKFDPWRDGASTRGMRFE